MSKVGYMFVVYVFLGKGVRGEKRENDHPV